MPSRWQAHPFGSFCGINSCLECDSAVKKVARLIVPEEEAFRAGPCSGTGSGGGAADSHRPAAAGRVLTACGDLERVWVRVASRVAWFNEPTLKTSNLIESNCSLKMVETQSFPVIRRFESSHTSQPCVTAMSRAHTFSKLPRICSQLGQLGGAPGPTRPKAAAFLAISDIAQSLQLSITALNLNNSQLMARLTTARLPV